MQLRALFFALGLAVSFQLAAQEVPTAVEPPRFDDRFGPQLPLRPPPANTPSLETPDRSAQEPRFGERFGPSESVGELTPPQPAVSRDAIPPSTQRLTASDVERDLSKLPGPVRVTRERLISVARAGDVTAFARIVSESPVRVQLGPDPVSDPAELWRAQNPDSDGREVLALVLGLLDLPYVRIDAGTPNEMYVWPAHAHLPLDQLSPAEEVELFRLITGAYLQEMRSAASWTFYRIGIAPDGALHYFIASE